MRPFCPLPWTRSRSAPSSRANLRTDGLAWARAMPSSLTGGSGRLNPAGTFRVSPGSVPVGFAAGAGADTGAGAALPRLQAPCGCGRLVVTAGQCGSGRCGLRPQLAASPAPCAVGCNQAASRDQRALLHVQLFDDARFRRGHIHGCLLGLERQQRRVDLDAVPGLYQQLDDGHVLEAAQIGHMDIFRSQGGSLNVRRCAGRPYPDRCRTSADAAMRPQFCDRCDRCRPEP